MSKLNPLPGEEGYERVYNAGEKGGGTWKKRNNTCCEICRNGGGGCFWSDAGAPVKGWIAEKSNVRVDKNMEMTSYMIYWCPEFEEGDIISENVQAVAEGRREPNEINEEGLMKLAEKLAAGIAKDYKDLLNEAEKHRKSFHQNKNRWEKYNNALLQLRAYDDVFPKDVRDTLQKQIGCVRNAEDEKKLAQVLEEVEKEKQQAAERKRIENEMLAIQKLAKVETRKAIKAEQKRVDKILLKEIAQIEKEIAQIEGEIGPYDCRL